MSRVISPYASGASVAACALFVAVAAAACGQSAAGKGSVGRSSYTLGHCPLTDACQTGATLGANGLCAYATLADGAPCGAGNVCIKDATCQGGRCQSTPALECRARGPCFLDGACDATRGCIDVPLDGPCAPGVDAMALTGCSTSDYAAPVALGGTTLSLIVDSGSTTTAVAGADCAQGCQGLSPVYEPSGAAVYGGRAYGSYGDLSAWGGRLVTDALELPALSQATGYTFADMSYASVDSAKTSAFFTPSYCSGQAANNTRQGIFGLGNSALAAPSATTVMDLLAQKGVTNAFATQFCDTAGRLWLGGYDPSFVEGAFAWAVADRSGGYYQVGVEDILVDGDSLGSSAADYGQAIADNGTSNLNVPTAVWQATVAALGANLKFLRFFPISMFTGQQACRAPNVDASRVELDELLPPFALLLRGAGGSTVRVDLQPTSSYLMYQPGPNGEALFCPSIRDSGGDPAGDSVATILGNSVMRDHVVVFDREHDRIGFALQKNCIGPEL